MSRDGNNIVARQKTRFANSGRAAGMGIMQDRYDENSWPDTVAGNRAIKGRTPMGSATEIEVAPVVKRQMTDEEKRKYGVAIKEVQA